MEKPICYVCKAPVESFSSIRMPELRCWDVMAKCHGDVDTAKLTDNILRETDPAKDWCPFEPDDFFACDDTGTGESTDCVVVAADGRRRVIAGPIPSSEIWVPNHDEDETRRVFRREDARDEQGRKVYREFI